MSYCLWMGCSLTSFSFMISQESTYLALANILGITGTYICLSNAFPDAVNLWAWVHSLNSCLVFADFWYCALYWNLFKHTWTRKVYISFLDVHNSMQPVINQTDFSSPIISDFEKPGLEYAQEQQDIALDAILEAKTQATVPYFLRIANVPAVSQTIIFCLTDWLLLYKHSLLFCVQIALAAVVM